MRKNKNLLNLIDETVGLGYGKKSRFAELIGVSKETISRWLNGDNPSYTNMVNISSKTNKEIKEIIEIFYGGNKDG